MQLILVQFCILNFNLQPLIISGDVTFFLYKHTIYKYTFYFFPSDLDISFSFPNFSGYNLHHYLEPKQLTRHYFLKNFFITICLFTQYVSVYLLCVCIHVYACEHAKTLMLGKNLNLFSPSTVQPDHLLHWYHFLIFEKNSLLFLWFW